MRALVVPAAVFAATLGAAQEKARPTAPIATDRPDFTESAVVVPRRWCQIESGFTYQASRDGRDLSGPELLLRYGLASHFELRLGIPSYTLARVGTRGFGGFGDTYVGVKIQVGPLADGTDVALIPAVFIPSGGGFSSRGIDPEVKVCLSRELGAGWSLSIMEYAAMATSEGAQRFAFQQTASFGRALSDRLSTFLEYAGTFSTDRPEHIVHVGLAYRTGLNAQFDIHFGADLGGNERRPFVAGGYAVRF